MTPQQIIESAIQMTARHIGEARDQYLRYQAAARDIEVRELLEHYVPCEQLVETTWDPATGRLNFVTNFWMEPRDENWTE